MPFEHDMGDSAPKDKREHSAKKSFEDSQEAAFRRLVRQSVRKGPFTKGERDVVLAFVNHWMHHRKKSGGVVHPGREKLAKRAGVSVRTVASVLEMLRQSGAIEAVAHLHGLYGNATEYTVSTVHLFELCAGKKPAKARIGVQNCTTVGCAEIAHRKDNVLMFPSQGLKASKGAA
jgi:hypothetical protein